MFCVYGSVTKCWYCLILTVLTILRETNRRMTLSASKNAAVNDKSNNNSSIAVRTALSTERRRGVQTEACRRRHAAAVPSSVRHRPILTVGTVYKTYLSALTSS